MNTKFKQTVVGEIPDDWDVSSIPDNAINLDSRRKPLSTAERIKKQGKYPYYGAAGIIDYIDEFLYEGKYLLIAEDGSVSDGNGYPTLQLTNGKFWVSNHAHVLQGNNYEETRYLYYALRNTPISAYITGAVQPKLNQENLNAILFGVPKDMEERRSIVGILSSLDDKIELNRKMNKTLEDTAKALFKYWFVDFEFPNEEGKPYKSSRGEMIESELGPIPKGWEVVDLPKMVDIQKGLSYKGNDLVESSNVGLVGLKCFERGGGFRYDGVKYYKGEYKTEHCLQSGDLVIAMTDLTQAAEVLGKPALIPTIYGIDALIASLDLSILKPKTKQLDQHFLYLLFDRQETQDFLFGYSNGSTVLHLSVKGLQEMKMTKPTDNILSLFQKLVNPMFFKIVEQNIGIDRLTMVRDSLLPKLMSGRIRV